MNNQSKKVHSKQDQAHIDLFKVLSRYSFNYQRPVADFSLKTYQEILSFIDNKPVLFDLGCGIGQSTYELANKYPELQVVGIDKSIHRLTRQNDFKENFPENAKIFRGEILDLIYLMHQSVQKNELSIKFLYLLYPNPWPKTKHLKRRFHANPIAPFLFDLGCPIILRSNWRVYLEEFSQAASFYHKDCRIKFKTLKIDYPMTPFEKKYFTSNQDLYEVIVEYKSLDK